MLNQKLVTAARNVLGSEPSRILVTGGTGFVGSHVAEVLAAAGQQVTVSGRNRYLAPQGIEFRAADITDREQVLALCSGQDFVIHCASNTSPSLSAKQLHATNVLGTQHVIDGCREHGVARMVHVSSTSIHFDFRDRFDITDDSPLPSRFACGYAETKSLAESRVQAASGLGLNVFTVRARAVFGPRDSSLLPRLFHAYDVGRLRQIGNGSNVTELTYIDNLVYGLVLALRHGPAGGVCTVTGEEPVQLWKLLRDVLKTTGRDRPLKQVSFPVALKLAQAMELSHRLRKKPGEPALTAYSVGLLAKGQTFSPAAAGNLLNYRPLVRMQDGITRTLQSLTVQDESQSKTQVRLTMISTGYTTAKHHWIEPGQSRSPIALHAAVGILEHPVFGISLFDTGYSPRFYDATQRWPYSLLARATPVVTDDQSSAVAIVERLGIDRHEVQRIIVSHFHSDHVCGLADFPNAEIVATRAAWESVRQLRGIAAVRRAIAPGLIPVGIDQRLCLFDAFGGAGYGPFEHTQDLFGDGSVRLFPLPGHAVGQLGVLVQTGPVERKFLVADAVWTERTIVENLKLTLPFLAIAADRPAARKTVSRLVEFHQQFSDIEIIPTHCPVIAQRYQFSIDPFSKTSVARHV